MDQVGEGFREVRPQCQGLPVGGDRSILSGCIFECTRQVGMPLYSSENTRDHVIKMIFVIS